MPNLRVLHVSDLHAGTHEEPEVEADLVELVRSTDPEVVLRGSFSSLGRVGRGLLLPTLPLPGLGGTIAPSH